MRTIELKGWVYGFLTGCSIVLADNINDLRIDNGMDSIWTLYVAFPLLVLLIKFLVEEGIWNT